MKSAPRLVLLLALMVNLGAVAAPDEEQLGKAAGYPAGRNLLQAYQERYLVGSFSAMDSLSPSCTMPASSEPLPLKHAATEPDFRYRYRGLELTLDNYMQRQRATAVLVLKDGEIVAERYNYDRARFNANVRRLGFAAAAALVTERDAEPGERFNYAGAQTAVLGLVLRGATKRTMCDYIADKLWQPMGAEAEATWLLPGSHRRFALLGVYGQAIFVDPDLRLVVVHLAVGKDASGDASGNHLAVERDALLRGIVAT